MKAYENRYASADEQIEFLISCGMEIADRARAKTCLERIGFYRLSSYWHSSLDPLPSVDSRTGFVTAQESWKFRPGTRFCHAFEFYVFDKKLRLIALDALERIEIGIRSEIVALLGSHSALVHRSPDRLKSGTESNATAEHACNGEHVEWLSRLDRKFSRSKEDFAKMFKGEFPGKLPPIWMVAELWDFGMLSHFFKIMKGADRNVIAERYGLPNGRMLESWLHNLNYIRNLCAHHSRLWNRNMTAPPMWPEPGIMPALDHLAGQIHSQARFYASALIILHLLRTINPNSSWPKRLKAHLATLPDSPAITMRSAGFPDGWKTEPIWL